ncbi:MAG: metallophosphoesterase [Porphyromonadaceae bacterium]|nr:MAG: metallophosphoesterase [Porphyromonadaceae bacterium]
MNKIGILIALALYGGINFYLFKRSWQALPANAPLQIVFTILFVVSSLSFFVAMGLGNRLPLGLIVVLENIGAFWIIGLLYFILAALFVDVLRVSNHFLKFYPDWVYANYQQVKFISLLSVIGLFAVFSIIGNYRFSHPAVRQLNLEIPKGDGQSGSLTIAVASDLHLGNIIRKNRLKKYVELINRQKADIIIFAGDLLDHSIRPVETQKMDEELQKLKAPYGVYAIFGNHEYYGNVSKAIDFYAQSGITLLRDMAVTIDNRFVLIGRDDLSQHRRKALDAILTGIDRNLPLILLDHNPARMGDALKNNIDLQLSGHTHNGQIFPLNLLVRKIYQLAYGYQKTGNTHYYVSSGLGLWGAPIRIGTQSEIVTIDLQLTQRSE